MDPRRVRELLEQVRDGNVNVEAAVASLQGLPFKDLGFATIDHHRALRQGVPEVVFGEGKTGEQIAGIAEEMMRAQTNVLVTRLDAAKAAVVSQRLPQLRYSPMGRTGFVEVAPPVKRPCAPVAVITAVTSDMPVS